MNRYISFDLGKFWVFKNKYVTIHLVDYPIDGIIQLKQLEKVHPGLTKNVNHGDIIENCNFHGYRSSGLSMVYVESNGEKRIINVGCGNDEIGSDCHPNTKFKIFKDFVPSYWNLKKAQVIPYKEGLESEAYWHDDYPLMVFPFNDFPELRVIDNYKFISLKIKGYTDIFPTYYTVFYHNGLKYLFCITGKRVVNTNNLVGNMLVTQCFLDMSTCPEFLNIIKENNIPIEHVISAVYYNNR